MVTRKALLFVLLYLLFCISIIHAAPFYDDSFIIVAEKGKDVICTFWGDEFESYIEDPNGYSIVYDNLYQRYVYATKDANGFLIPSLRIVGRDAPIGDPHLRISGDALSEADSLREVFSVPDPPSYTDIKMSNVYTKTNASTNKIKLKT